MGVLQPVAAPVSASELVLVRAGLSETRVSLGAMSSPPWSRASFASLCLCFLICAMGPYVPLPHRDTWTAPSACSVPTEPLRNLGARAALRALLGGRHQAQAGAFPRISRRGLARGSNSGLPSCRARVHSPLTERAHGCPRGGRRWMACSLRTVACAWSTRAWTHRCPVLGARGETWVQETRGGFEPSRPPEVDGRLEATCLPGAGRGPPDSQWVDTRPSAELLRGEGRARARPAALWALAGRALSPRGQAVPGRPFAD